jgi:hypothetical protein
MRKPRHGRFWRQRLTVLLAGLALVGGLLPACRSWTRASPPVEESFVEDIPSLKWIMRGSRLLVNGRWVLEPSTGKLTALPYETAQALPNGGLRSLRRSFSWDGERVVLWTPQEFSYGPALSALTGPVAIPSLLKPLTDADTGEPIPPGQALFWVSPHHILVEEFDPTSNEEPRCALFDTRVSQWRPVVHCPSGGVQSGTQIEPGPDGWLAITSSTEGVGYLRLTRYDVEKGQADTPALDYTLFPTGSLQVQFSLDGRRIDLLTDCQLQNERPCLSADGENWRLYSWLVPEQKLGLVRDGLTHSILPSPGGESWAWLLPDRVVCLADPVSLDHKRCFRLPGSGARTDIPE